MVSSISSTNSYILQLLQQTAQQRQDDFFSKVDSSGDGKIDKTEFSALAKKLSENKGSSINVDDVFSMYDTNNDGTLSSDELNSYMKDNAPPPPDDRGAMMGQMSAQAMQQRLDDLFSKIDTSGDISIDKSEFSVFAKKISSDSGTTINVDDVFSKYDTDNNGALSKDELTSYMKDNAPPPPPTQTQNALSAYGANSGSDMIAELLDLLKKQTTGSSALNTTA
jgi:Ca2+-binding EF-hand superfamily protein